MKRNEHDAHHHLASTRRRTETPVAYRRHDLNFFDHLVGLASGISLIGVVFIAGLGAALHLPDALYLGGYLGLAGCVGIVYLILRSDA